MDRSVFRTVWAACLLASALSLASASPARAESGRFDVHLEGGVLVPPVGGWGGAAFDWQFAPPVALELSLGGGATVGEIGGSYGLFVAAVGARIRILDDESGYPADGGSIHGSLWVAPHVGLAMVGVANAADGAVSAAFSFDVAAGYDISIADPVSIGVYVRPIFLVSDTNFAVAFTGGLTLSIEIDPFRGPIDPDRDHDGVLNESDRCPRTPEGTAVDATGCVPIVEVLVLEGITFLFDSAEIQSGHEDDLAAAARMLEDHPELRVEIGGHTDDIGDPAHNEQLSRARAQSVADWLIAHGIEQQRLRVRGYGASQPREPNTDEASRARNRRIEFRVLSR